MQGERRRAQASTHRRAMIPRRAAGGSARRLVKFREVAADERVALNWLARYAAVFVAELARVAAEGVVLA